MHTTKAFDTEVIEVTLKPTLQKHAWTHLLMLNYLPQKLVPTETDMVKALVGFNMRLFTYKKNTSFSSVIGTSITLTITVCTASTVCTIKHHSLATGNA